MHVLTGLDLWNVWAVRCLGTPGTCWQHCSQACVYSNQTTWHKWLETPFETLGNAITETLIFKSSLDALAPKNLCLWCEFHSLSACYLIKTFWQPCVNAKNTWSVWFACALVAYLWAVRHSSEQISIPVTQLPKKGRREQHHVPKHHYISYSSCCILHLTGSNLTGIIY